MFRSVPSSGRLFGTSAALARTIHRGAGMLTEFAAGWRPLWNESCSRSYNLNEEQLQSSEKPSGPG